MNNSHASPVFVAFLVAVAAMAELAAGHWLNALLIVIGAVAIGLMVRWLYSRLNSVNERGPSGAATSPSPLSPTPHRGARP